MIQLVVANTSQTYYPHGAAPRHSAIAPRAIAGAWRVNMAGRRAERAETPPPPARGTSLPAGGFGQAFRRGVVAVRPHCWARNELASLFASRAKQARAGVACKQDAEARARCACRYWRYR